MNFLNKIKNTYDDYSSQERNVINDRIGLIIFIIIAAGSFWVGINFPPIMAWFLAISVSLLILWGLYIFLKPVINLVRDSFK
jgi:hypothetical protein